MAGGLQISLDAVKNTTKGLMTTLRQIYDAGLSVLEVRSIYQNILLTQLPFSDDDDLPYVEERSLWVSVLLKKVRPPLSSEQRQLILQILYNTNGWKFGTADWLLTFVDGKYFTHSGLRGFVDLTSGNRVDKLTSPSVISVGYNINAFIHRQTAGTPDDNPFATDAGSGTPNPQQP